MSILSKYKEFQEYVSNVIEQVAKLAGNNYDHLISEVEVIYSMDTVLESYIIRDKPKDCAKKILGEENE